MSTHKNIDKICCVVLAVTLAITILFMNGPEIGIEAAARTVGYESRLFDTSRVHTIDIVMDDWDGFLETCTSEEYTNCAVVIDNESYKNVAIRAKGNTSLSQVSTYGSERYSFKIEFDHYDSSKTYHGLDKLCLNNIIQDNTYMKDYLTYQMMGYFGVSAPLCSFVYITVNGEDWGLYLAVEGVEDSFLERNYGENSGELYKPDSQSMGGGRGNGQEFNMDDHMEELFGTVSDDSADSAQSTKDAQSADSAQDTDEAQSGDSAQGTDEAQSADSAKNSDDAQSADTAQGTDEAQSADNAQGTDEAQSADSAKSTDDAKSADSAQDTDGMQAGEMPQMPDGTSGNGQQPGNASGEMPQMPNGSVENAGQTSDSTDGAAGQQPGDASGEMPQMPDGTSGNGQQPGNASGEMLQMPNESAENAGQTSDSTDEATGQQSDGTSENAFSQFSFEDFMQQAGNFGDMTGGMFGDGGMDGGMSIGSDDTKLIYTDDDYDSYSNIFDSAKTDITDSDKDRLIASLKSLNENENIEEVVDVDAVIRYFVVHNFVLNFDSYTGSMIHNYYLYESDGQLSMIPWDYNLAFGGFQSAADATSLVNYPIDSPVSGGTVDSRPMLAWIFANEEYTELYHQYFSEFISEYFDSGYFEEMIDSVQEMISPYVEKDPTKFCTYEEFETAITTLKEFCLLRAESITGQLDGTIGSTTETQAQTSDAMIDAGDINISDMGSMNNSMGGFGQDGGMGGDMGGFGQKGGMGGEMPTGGAPEAGNSDGAVSTQPENGMMANQGAMQPDAIPVSATANISAETEDESEQISESVTDAEAENAEEDESSSENMQSPSDMQFPDGMQSPDMDQQFGGQMESTQNAMSTIILLGASALVLLAGLLFAFLYRGRR
jgi:spore coat protein CotH